MPQSATGAVAAKVAAETAESPAAAGGTVEAVVAVEGTAFEARDEDFRPAAGGSEWNRSRNHLGPKAGPYCPEPKSSES